MPIQKTGWEMHIVRKTEQKRPDGKRRTVGSYQVFHDGVPQPGPGLSGTVAETRGPGRNRPRGNRRILPGRYPLFTQDGARYVTIGFKQSNSRGASPKPGIELKETDERTEILIHPGQGFLSSIGCINPCTSLPSAAEPIDYVPSRKRILDIIDDLRAFAGNGFPARNGKRIPQRFRRDRRRAGPPGLSIDAGDHARRWSPPGFAPVLFGAMRVHLRGMPPSLSLGRCRKREKPRWERVWLRM